jgi:Uma2 family endonuclease
MSTAKRSPKLGSHDHIQLPIGDEVVFEDLYRNPDKHTLPDHTHLPDRDENFVQNFQEHPQSVLLTDSIAPVLDRRHPDGRYAIGQDCGIYWKLVDPPQRGAVCPDWFYVPDVPPTLDGLIRRSYVLWQEDVPPLIVLEFVSGDGSEERDRTPMTGKFWVYENVIRPAFYGIYEVTPGRVEMYHLVNNRFVPLPPNERGRFPIEGMGAEIGIWHGHYQNMILPWMRWWDADGTLLPTGHELAAFETNRAQREAERAERLAAQLRALGIEPDA